jgi:hypothetical protein
MKVFRAMALIAVLAVGPVYADCTYPAAPGKLPDGATATLDEMLAGQKLIKEYDTAIKAYVDCIDKELDQKIASAGDKLKPEQKADMQKVEAQKHNAAIDQLQGVADRFNEQVKVFKARTDKKG